MALNEHERHLLDCGRSIIEWTSALSLEEFEEDKLLRSATLYQLIIFGEMCRVVLETRSRFSARHRLKKLVMLRSELAHDPEVDAYDALSTAREHVPQICLTISGSGSCNGIHT